MRESIDWVLAQTFTDFEFIIIDDGSTDSTPDILADYAARDSRIRILRNESNISVPASLNRGLREARGKYVARIDGDDLCEPMRFARQYDFLESHPDYVLVGGGYQTIDADGRPVKMDVAEVEDWAFLWTSIFRPPLVHSSAMYRTGAIQKNSVYFDQTFDGAADFEFWHRLLKLGRGCVLGGVYVHYRMHPDNVSTRKAAKQQTSAQRAGLINATRQFPNIPQADIDALFQYIIPVDGRRHDDLPGALRGLQALEASFIREHRLSPQQTRRIRNLTSRWLAAAAIGNRRGSRAVAACRLLWSGRQYLPNFLLEATDYVRRRAPNSNLSVKAPV